MFTLVKKLQQTRYGNKANQDKTPYLIFSKITSLLQPPLARFTPGQTLGRKSSCRSSLAVENGEITDC